MGSQAAGHTAAVRLFMSAITSIPDSGDTARSPRCGWCRAPIRRRAQHTRKSNRAVGGLTVFLKSYGRVFAFKSTCEEEAHSRRPVPRPLGFGEHVATPSRSDTASVQGRTSFVAAGTAPTIAPVWHGDLRLRSSIRSPRRRARAAAAEFRGRATWRS
jgi:hypothetical protein